MSTEFAIRCNRDDLLAAIQAADAVVPTSSPKPILTNLQLEAKQSSLEIIATDLQVGLRSILTKVDVQKAGQAVVQARQLAGILKESRSHEVTMSLTRKEDQSLLTIAFADGDYQVPAVIGETFPPVGFFPTDVPSVTINAARLDEMIRQTIFAVDKDRTSAVLSGLYLAVNENEVILAATDGKVLCEAVDKGAYAVPESIGVIVPAVTINHLSRILIATKAESAQLAVAGKLIFFRVLPGNGGPQVEVTSRLVEGTFPPYRNALPPSSGTKASFDTVELASAVRRTALMTSNTSRGIVLTLNPDQAVLSNLNYTNGSARIPLQCAFQGQAMKLGVNAQYIGDVLKVYKSPRIDIEISRGLIMREPGVTYLIMPISLPN
jgi:DNA polymerase III subunit beta